MAVQADGNAPYAPFSVVKSVIERHRQVKLPTITPDVLLRMGVTESLAPRSLQALRLLDLVDDQGQPTPTFEAIRKAPTEELAPRLAELVRQAYEPVFAVIDPTTATVQQIADAFRGFHPPGQRERMVSRFMGLMAYAGMIETAPKRTPGPRQTRAPRSNGAQQQPVTTPPPAPTEGVSRGTPQPPDQHARTVALRTGGSITLSVDLNPLVLRGPERTFFNALVDLVDQYEDNFPSVDAPTGVPPVEQEV